MFEAGKEKINANLQIKLGKPKMYYTKVFKGFNKAF